MQLLRRNKRKWFRLTTPTYELGGEVKKGGVLHLSIELLGGGNLQLAIEPEHVDLIRDWLEKSYSHTAEVVKLYD